MIKFRAWDDREKEYIKDVLIGSDGKIYFDDGVATQDDLDISVERFTGLKDVNGKDIYEGDIVSVFNEDGNYYNDVIEWCIKYNYPAFDLKYHSYLYASNALSEIMNAGVENIKVIGNVHENPELLKG